MTLPAVTLCLASLQSFSTNLTLEETLFYCEIDRVQCDHNDFFSFETRVNYSKSIINCYVLNGGRNSSGHLNKLKSTRTTGPSYGFLLRLYLPRDHYLFYYISDAYVKPTTSEIDKRIIPGTSNDLKLDLKLTIPSIIAGTVLTCQILL